MDRIRPVQEEKASLRRRLRQKMEALSPRERSRRSRAILDELLDHPRFSEARSVLTYVALRREVETRPLIEEAWKRGKKVYVPRVDPERKRIAMIEIQDLKELKPGAYGILEPPYDPGRVGKPEELDLAVIPGVGFDREGGRLGRGEGYFDRFLKEAKKAYKIGLAFECQIIERIPREASDVVLDEVLIA